MEEPSESPRPSSSEAPPASKINERLRLVRQDRPQAFEVEDRSEPGRHEPVEATTPPAEPSSAAEPLGQPRHAEGSIRLEDRPPSGETSGPAAEVPRERSEEDSRAREAAELEVPDRFRDLPVVDVDSGRVSEWNRALHRPLPETVYRVDGRHLFVTDADRRVTHVESQLTYVEPAEAELKRNTYQQGVAGRACRLELDDGGHLIAVSLGGPGEGINLVAMSRELNRGGQANWNAMEKDFRDSLKKIPPDEIVFRVDVTYPEDGSRPRRFAVEYSINGDIYEKEFKQ